MMTLVEAKNRNKKIERPSGFIGDSTQTRNLWEKYRRSKRTRKRIVFYDFGCPKTIRFRNTTPVD